MFSNVKARYFGYWSGTEYAPDPNLAWSLGTVAGDQLASNKVNHLYAVAVRNGDVVASVPEPQTWTLALLALGATVVARRRVTVLKR